MIALVARSFIVPARARISSPLCRQLFGSSTNRRSIAGGLSLAISAIVAKPESPGNAGCSFDGPGGGKRRTIIRANHAASVNTKRRTRHSHQSRLAKKSAQTGTPKAKGAHRQHAKRQSALRPKIDNRQTQLFSSSAHTSTT